MDDDEKQRVSMIIASKMTKTASLTDEKVARTLFQLEKWILECNAGQNKKEEEDEEADEEEDI